MWLLIAKTAEDFQDFAPGGKHAAALGFVLLNGLHELQLGERIIAFAGGWIDEPASTAGMTGLGSAESLG